MTHLEKSRIRLKETARKYGEVAELSIENAVVGVDAAEKAAWEQLARSAIEYTNAYRAELDAKLEDAMRAARREDGHD